MNDIKFKTKEAYEAFEPIMKKYNVTTLDELRNAIIDGTKGINTTFPVNTSCVLLACFVNAVFGINLMTLDK